MNLISKIWRVMNYEWDPLNVSSFVDNEYDNYVGGAFDAAKISKQAVFEYLKKCEEEFFALTPNLESIQLREQVAEKIYNLSVAENKKS